MKSKLWIIMLSAVFILCAGLSLPLLLPGTAASFAQIRSDGAVVETVDLRIDRVLTVEGENGMNVVTVRDGKIAVTEADCPDHHCMARGFCSGGTAIVCLPNKLVITFADDGGADGAVG